MSSALDWIADDRPQHLEPFTRLRAQRKPDRYNPERTVEDWSQPPVELSLSGAWSSGGSTAGTDAVREQRTTTKQIVIFDPEADVVAGDRVRAADGTVHTVTGRPERDQNPFTGWRPTLVLNVEEVTG
ncbi:hypothetical protein [Microbacterium luteum]|uniref:hypothetical protein n=1 Tax=Microbacterium luteum TaxID=2782167 RepID=UPI001886E588|nr:hypothetical protein [Microbacterium luteum]